MTIYPISLLQSTAELLLRRFKGSPCQSAGRRRVWAPPPSQPFSMVQHHNSARGHLVQSHSWLDVSPELGGPVVSTDQELCHPLVPC